MSFDGAFAIGVIEDFGVRYRVTRRRTETTLRHGIAEPVAGTQANQTFEIVAVVQPKSGRELQRLPEQRRSLETKQIFTVTRLQVGGEGNGSEADLVEIDGVPWEVQNVKHWPDSHYDCLAQKPAAP